METIATPAERFENLPDFDFPAHFVTLPDGEGGTLKMAYVEAGPKDGQAVVLIHGNPTWSFMWRKILPRLADAGYRAIAIDLIGMGRSDKPTKMSDYTIARHVAWVAEALFGQLKLQNVHFVLHDWGGIIGLRVIADHQAETASVTFSNTGFPAPDPNEKRARMAIPGMRFLRAFQIYVRFKKNWQHWKMLAKFTKTTLPPEVVAGFAAPYPDKKYLTGNRQFTQMLPTRYDNPMFPDNWKAREKLQKFDKPFLCLFSDKDQVAPNGHVGVRAFIPSAAARAPVILKGGSHFLLEDVPQEYGDALLAFLNEQQ